MAEIAGAGDTDLRATAIECLPQPQALRRRLGNSFWRDQVDMAYCTRSSSVWDLSAYPPLGWVTR